VIRRASTSLVFSAALTLAAAAWVVVALVAALRVELPAASAPRDGAAAGAIATMMNAPADESLVRRAVEADPFAIGLTERAPSFFSDDSAAATPASTPLLRLLGTVIDDDGDSFAMCQLGELPARVVRVGDRIGDWRLRALRPGAADFVGPDGRITLHVPHP